MNVHRILPGSRAAAGQVTSQEAAEAESSRARPAQAPPTADSSGREDRFELSDAARARQAEAAARKAELDDAREALHTLASMSPERASALRERIAEGYYDKPEVIEAVASKLAAALQREAGEASGS